MKKLFLIAGLGILAVCFGTTWLLQAQDQPAARYEYAIVKWDGPDRLFYNLPGRFELVHLEKQGTKIPKDAQDEEYCLAVGCNVMARDGWEPINIDSRRILFRRVAAR